VRVCVCACVRVCVCACVRVCVARERARCDVPWVENKRPDLRAPDRERERGRRRVKHVSSSDHLPSWAKSRSVRVCRLELARVKIVDPVHAPDGAN
jgi:hypothetical protein